MRRRLRLAIRKKPFLYVLNPFNPMFLSEVSSVMASCCKINFYEKPITNIPGLSFTNVGLKVATDKIHSSPFLPLS
jgi:hypothetical protein